MDRISPTLSRRSILASLAVGATATACKALTAEEQDALASEAAAARTNSDNGQTAAPSTESTTDDGLASVHPELTPKADLQTADSDETHIAYAPKVPPAAKRDEQRLFVVSMEVVEGNCPLDPENDVETLMWGYRIAKDDRTCGTPGPVIRGRVGDVARITMTNLASNKMAHNIDFHAVTGQGGGAEALTAAPGESATIEVRLLYPGAFMYHCAFGDVPEHIARGMYGMFIVDPETPLPSADHEWAVIQSEWYVDEPDDQGFAMYNRDLVVDEEPRYVTFNGQVGALTGDNALTMKVGERSRIYMVNEGLNLDSNFHPIGSHWDAVWPEAATHPSNKPIRGSQSTLVVAGGGTVADIVGLVPSTIILVDHALNRAFYKGTIGQVVVEGEEDAELFEVTQAAAAAGAAGVAATEAGATESTEGSETAADAVETDTVEITAEAYDPANADNAFSPKDISVPVGTTVTWTNNDMLPHTVTSGTSDGRSGRPDGVFDSGNMDPEATFEFTFDEEGAFPYYCTPHPWMKGTVTVVAA